MYDPSKNSLFLDGVRVGREPVHKKAETESSEPIAFSNQRSEQEMLRQNIEMRS